MSNRCWVRSTALGVVLAVGLLAPAFAAAQAPSGAPAKATATGAGSKTQSSATAKTSTIPRTAEGIPICTATTIFLRLRLCSARPSMEIGSF